MNSEKETSAKELLTANTPGEAEWIESIIRQGSDVHLGNVKKGREVRIKIDQRIIDADSYVIAKVDSVMKVVGFERMPSPATLAFNIFGVKVITLHYKAVVDVDFSRLYRVDSKSCIETPPDFERGIISKSSPSISPDDSVVSDAPSVELRGQVGGDHYAKCAIQPIDYIMANGLDYLQGNVIKYVTRYKDKNGVEDLEKAAHYLRIMIEREKQKDEAKS